MTSTRLYKIKTTTLSAVLALAIASTSSQSIAGGGGGGVIIQAVIIFFTSFIVSQSVTTALIGTNVTHDRIPSDVAQVPSQYVKSIVNSNLSSIWMITALTPQVRLQLAQYYYYLVFRYAAIAQTTNIVLPGITTHPNSLSNQVATAALQGFVQTTAEIEQYKNLQKTFLLLSLVMMQNPYSPLFILNIGRHTQVDLTYVPEVFLAETVTYLVLLNFYSNFIDRLIETRTQQVRNERIRRENSAVMALMILQFVINYRLFWQGRPI